MINIFANYIIDAGRDWGSIIAYSCLGDTWSLLTLVSGCRFNYLLL